MNKKSVIIPNPIYDVSFRYLMADNESAKLIISTLLGKNIIQLTRKNHSLPYIKHRMEKDSEAGVKMMHLDFSATIQTDDGEQAVIIEMQKSEWTGGDVFRFKRYIQENFSQKKTSQVIDTETGEVSFIYEPIILIPIFILDFCIEKEIHDPIIRTNRKNIGFFTEKELKESNFFIDNLSYNMVTVQIPNINKIPKSMYAANPQKEMVYHLLEIFNQKNILNGDKRSLQLDEYDVFFERVVKRLLSAREEYPELAIEMEEEENYLNDIKIATIQASNARFEAKELRKNLAQAEQEKAKAEQEKTEQQNRAERAEQE
ncbi:MAG: hypothetical protein QM536_08240, partial [Chitinophagaceae bacterium]|nr:hypothetical protein [Chitinophagaceae bacterium]